MKIRRRFLLALLASLMLHLGVISGPGWHLPVLDDVEEQTTLDAHLGAPPKPAMRPRVAVELLPARSICSVEPMNMSHAYSPAVWHIARLLRMLPSRPVKKTSGRAAT